MVFLGFHLGVLVSHADWIPKLPLESRENLASKGNSEYYPMGVGSALVPLQLEGSAKVPDFFWDCSIPKIGIVL